MPKEKDRHTARKTQAKTNKQTNKQTNIWEDKIGLRWKELGTCKNIALVEIVALFKNIF